MKRFLQRLTLLLAVLLLLTTAVFADMGPKPQLTVVVEHAPSELYYLDLLAKGEYEYDAAFAATFVPTILIELVALLLFGFKLKENWKPFLLVNLVTQGGDAGIASLQVSCGAHGFSESFHGLGARRPRGAGRAVRSCWVCGYSVF